MKGKSTSLSSRKREYWAAASPKTFTANLTLLQTGEVEGVAAADHTRGVMQFSLAADRILGGFFDPEGLEDRGSDLGANTQREGRDNMRGNFGM
jgi:hypothetical protein